MWGTEEAVLVGEATSSKGHEPYPIPGTVYAAGWRFLSCCFAVAIASVTKLYKNHHAAVVLEFTPPVSPATARVGLVVPRVGAYGGTVPQILMLLWNQQMVV